MKRAAALAVAAAGVAFARAPAELPPYPREQKRPAGCDGRSIVCEASGSGLALALNAMRFRLDEAKRERSKGRLARCRQSAGAAAGLAERGRRGRAGGPVIYMTHDGTFAEAQALAALSSLEAEAGALLAACSGPRSESGAGGERVPSSGAADAADPPSRAPARTPPDPPTETPPRPRAVAIATTLPAAGRCHFGDCFKDGWALEAPGASGDARCQFQDCGKDGWMLDGRDGSIRTECRFGRCFSDGWTTRFPDGREAQTDCLFQDCGKDGWTTRLPGGGEARTRCLFQRCFSDGWTTELPGGRSIECRCEFGDCRKNGARCGW